MHVKRTRNRVVIAREIYFFFPLLLLLIPIRLILALMIAVAVHELFHIAAIRWMKIPIDSVCFGIRGAKINTAPMSRSQELICSAAGPLGGFSLLLLFRWIPIIALAGAVQSLYNLIPIYPADGSRVLSCIVYMLFSEKTAQKVQYMVEIFALSAIMAVAIYGCIWLRLGILPLCIGICLVLQAAKRK